jgi:hypothetical protein
MGQTMQEHRVKAGLRRLNPELHFDMGACLNLWHPFMDSRQNVFYRGDSVGAMDRRTLPEIPIWTMKRDMVEVHWTEVKPGEIALYGSAGVSAKCLKCFHSWDLGFRPKGTIFCPSLCGNIASSTDTTHFEWANKMKETAHVFRKVQDRVILVGWRHTFYRLMRAGIPGITKAALELEFGVNLDPKVVDAVMVDSDIEGRTLDARLEVA